MRKVTDPIKLGLICPYCSRETEKVSRNDQFGAGKGYVRICHPCSAWVGVHYGSDRAMGSVAQKPLRAARIEAHKHFDPAWERLHKRGYKKAEAKKLAYTWLARVLGIPVIECHIGMMNLDQCERTIEVCKHINKMQR